MANLRSSLLVQHAIATCGTSMALTLTDDIFVRANERWFSSRGCVVHRGEERDVFVGGTLIGSFHLD